MREPVGLQHGIADGMLDIFVAKIVLDGPRVVSLVRQLIATRMAQHVRMDGKRQGRGVAGAREHLAESRPRHGRAAFRGKDV